MAKSRIAGTYRGIRTLYSVGTIRDSGDGQLLERFANEQGEAAELAFAVLVERHGPMVLRVCHGVLSDWNDIEDTFQATFLILVKKARGLWVKDSLGPWLHQVAVRTASAARVAAARRRRCEEYAAVAVAVEPAQDRAELEQVVHAEINRLPARFRLPVILCDLEERSHQQAARHLGWPIGTVKSRLARGRKRLRERLGRLGLSPSAGLFVGAAPREASIALRLSALVDSTARAAVQTGTTRAIRAGSIAALADACVKPTIASGSLKLAAVVLCLATAGAGAGLIALRSGLKQDRTGAAPKTAAPGEAVSQRDEFPRGTLNKIEFQGTIVPAEKIEPILTSKAGQALSREKLEADLKALLRTKWFSEISYSLQETPKESGKYTAVFSLRDMLLVVTVKPGPLKAVVSESGFVRRANTEYGICELEGESVITWILPDRSVVKKGDLVCQLDSLALTNQIRHQAQGIELAERAP